MAGSHRACHALIFLIAPGSSPGQALRSISTLTRGSPLKRSSYSGFETARGSKSAASDAPANRQALPMLRAGRLRASIAPFLISACWRCGADSSTK